MKQNYLREVVTVKRSMKELTKVIIESVCFLVNSFEVSRTINESYKHVQKLRSKVNIWCTDVL